VLEQLGDEPAEAETRVSFETVRIGRFRDLRGRDDQRAGETLPELPRG
jgi:hypothetical protein